MRRVKPDESAKHTKVWIRGFNKLAHLRDHGGFPYDIVQMRIGAWMYEEGWLAGQRAKRRHERLLWKAANR